MTFTDRFLASKFTIWIILVFHFIVWFSVFTVLDVHPDMADHWIWSRHLSFGYYEHPPLVALTMRLVSIVFSDVVFGLKLGSVLFSAGILYLGYLAAQEFYGRKTALVFVLMLESTPYFSIGSVFWHIDQPYMAFWLVCLFAIAKYINKQKPNWLLVFGVAAGLGAMSKYTMILLPISMLFWLIFSVPARKLLSQWQTYAGAAIALLIVAPNIYWNSQHEWVTFGFVLEKGLKGASFGVHFLHFILSQLVLFSVVYTLYFWGQLLQKNIKHSLGGVEEDPTDQKRLFLMCTGLVPFVFFSITSFLGSRTDPHWVNVAYFSCFLLLARFAVFMIGRGQTGRQVMLFFSSTALTYGVLILSLIQIHFIFIPYRFPDTPAVTSLVGWNQTAEQIKELCDYSKIKVPANVISREYQLSSALGLYMHNHPYPHAIEKEARNQWSPVSKLKKEGALLVCPPDECEHLLGDAEPRFKTQFKYLGEIKTIHFGKVLRKLKVFHLPPK